MEDSTWYLKKCYINNIWFIWLIWGIYLNWEKSDKIFLNFCFCDDENEKNSKLYKIIKETKIYNYQSFFGLWQVIKCYGSFTVQL
jgi:hypothetical protein